MIEQYVNTIQNMDCLKMMKQLPDNSIDMILCEKYLTNLIVYGIMY